ncbi:unnamed protein product [Zymoseptoria tritici ST99CH_1E4]|uniref:BZIP domain-containing protein n=1 Tax=Zymoseptoria tritici ST99CH_1E4 TaxID=1276532 RepID=A0A2H1FLQ1_ZYMTR|nr:unnamed protein product [Zymoseptoria tritici ST99CH_1E4]
MGNVPHWFLCSFFALITPPADLRNNITRIHAGAHDHIHIHAQADLHAQVPAEEPSGNHTKDLMSDRTKDTDAPESSTVRGSESSHRSDEPSRANRHDGDPSHAASMTSAQVSHRQTSGSDRSMQLPPLHQAQMFTPRPAGVSSMLNPFEFNDHSANRRRKFPQMDGPDPPKPILPPLNRDNHPYQTSSGANTPVLPRMNTPRKILTPLSPSMHRAASLNQLSQPNTTFGSQQSSSHASPRTQSYAIAAAGQSAVPPLPTMSTAPRQHSGASRMMRPLSESTSPRSSFSSYSHAENTSPTGQYAPSLMPTLSSAYPASETSPAGQDQQRQMGVPVSSSNGQNVYQMMTLETTSGTVQLPVDVQAASRVADEKRRRNAGASARFRQRRKEKEREASTTISRLEQQIKNFSEDADFYKRERDYLAGVVLQVPGGDRHFPRPQSPRHRRRPSIAGSSTSAMGYMTMHDQDRHSPDDGRNVRRRTSTMSLPPPPPPQSQVPAPMSASNATFAHPHFSHSYGHPSGPQLQQGPAPLPLPSNTGVSSTPHPQLMQAAPQTGPWNPYADRRFASAPGPSHR